MWGKNLLNNLLEIEDWLEGFCKKLRWS